MTRPTALSAVGATRQPVASKPCWGLVPRAFGGDPGGDSDTNLCACHRHQLRRENTHVCTGTHGISPFKLLPQSLCVGHCSFKARTNLLEYSTISLVKVR